MAVYWAGREKKWKQLILKSVLSSSDLYRLFIGKQIVNSV